ncbi:MAG: hypothetical protein DMF53_06260, partial [Acidobacteria bacterium]
MTQEAFAVSPLSSRVSQKRRAVLRKRRAESRTRFRLSRNEIAVSRRLCPHATGVKGDVAEFFQILENPVERAAIRIVAERPADVGEREQLGEMGEGCQDLLVELAGPPSPPRGRLWRRGLRRSRGRRRSRMRVP